MKKVQLSLSQSKIEITSIEFNAGYFVIKANCIIEALLFESISSPFPFQSMKNNDINKKPGTCKQLSTDLLQIKNNNKSIFHPKYPRRAEASPQKYSVFNTIIVANKTTKKKESVRENGNLEKHLL